MSDKIPTTSRLDSLSRRTPGSSSSTAKPGLKFKPKVVARRTKEERDADAPTNAPEIKKHTHSNRGGARGRGSMRGGRGGRNLAGTHLVQAGPLASGSALLDSKQPLGNRSHSASPIPEYLSTLMKRDITRESSPELDSDEEEDVNKIDMSKEYQFANSELFPVRASRSNHVDESESKTTDRSPSASSLTVSSETSGDIPMDDNLPTSVKDEPTETDLNALLKQKDAELHKRLNTLQLDSSFIVQSTDVETAKQELEDQKAIVKKLLDTDNRDDQFLFVQLPRILPKFEDLHSPVGLPDVKDEKSSAKDEVIRPQVEGEIGKLRVHKSGRVTMKIGNVVLDIGRGSETKFLQEVVLIESDEEKKTSYLLGHVQDKLVATPKFE